MENMRKIVTAKDVAKAAGCSVGSVWNHYSSRYTVGKELAERIEKAAAELSYDPKETTKALASTISVKRWKNRPTMSAVAAKCGLATATVSRAFLSDSRVSEANKQKIFQAAEEIGFVYRPTTKNPEERKARLAAKNKAEKERKFSLRYAGFKSIEEQNQYMETMRTMGYSNAQICRKVGLTIQTVRRRIGKQPDDMTKANVVAGQKHRAAENHRRKVYVDTHLVTTYNNLIVECAQIRSQAAELLTKADNVAKEINKLRPQVEKAVLSTVKPAELPPEQLSMVESKPASAVLQ